MSYVLQIWRTPIPVSVSEADDICSRLQREGAAPRPEYTELAARLVARYADIGDLDEDDDPGVWTDGPLAANAGASVFGVGVQTHALGEVVPFVIETARALGLLVYDFQAGAVYLADGRVLGLEHGAIERAPEPSPAGAFVTRAEVRRVLCAALGPALAARGFAREKGDHAFVLHTEAVRFDVDFQIDAVGNGHHVYVCTLVTPVCREPSGLLERFYPQHTDFLVHHQRLAAAHGLDWADMEKSPGSGTYVESAADLEQSAQRWLTVYQQAVLPLIDRCRTLHGLSSEMIDNMSAFSQRLFTLTLAAAMGRTDLPEIGARLKKWIPSHLQYRVDEHLAELRPRR